MTQVHGLQKKQETRMSKSMKIVMAVCLVAFVGACAKKPAPEPVYIQQPVTAEPTLQKY